MNHRTIDEWRHDSPKGTSGAFELKTSGTTSLSKTINVRMNHLMRNVIVTSNHMDDVWGLTYPVDRFAGLQVLLQAVSNLNTIVDLTPNHGIATSAAIMDQKVTHLSGTPTYYRLLLRTGEVFPLVTQVTSGGECLDKPTIDLLRQHFPNSKIKNIFGSTETGTLFTSTNDEFGIPEKLKGKISLKDGRLLIHHSLLADFDAELEDGFYFTGDLVKIVNECPIRFTIQSRNANFISVAGHKVDPEKIERVIMENDEIAETLVYAIPNPVTGNLIACDLLKKPDSSISIDKIRGKLKSKLRSHEVPRIIKCVDSIKQTDTGKKVRR